VKDTDLAYLAGIIDSDGYISVGRRHYSKSNRDYFYGKIGFTQVTPQAFELMIQLGGGVRQERPALPGRRPIFRWEASSRRANTILRLLLPYLRIKKEQAMNVLALDDARGSRNRRGVARGLPILTLEEEASFRRFYERSLALNKVGA
jgi:hypothetical protein